MTALGPLYQRGRLAGAAARRVRGPHLLLLLLLLTLSRPRGGYVARAGDDESPPVRSTPRGFEDTAPVPFPSRRPHAVRARARPPALPRAALAPDVIPCATLAPDVKPRATLAPDDVTPRATDARSGDACLRLRRGVHRARQPHDHVRLRCRGRRRARPGGPSRDRIARSMWRGACRSGRLPSPSRRGGAHPRRDRIERRRGAANDRGLPRFAVTKRRDRSARGALRAAPPRRSRAPSCLRTSTSTFPR